MDELPSDNPAVESIDKVALLGHVRLDPRGRPFAGLDLRKEEGWPAEPLRPADR